MASKGERVVLLNRECDQAGSDGCETDAKIGPDCGVFLNRPAWWAQCSSGTAGRGGLRRLNSLSELRRMFTWQHFRAAESTLNMSAAV